ncbi:MAG TPA: tRNA (adenosine(37)-N6)-threonylcarbamoyltransferase complex dimerization subunit type 1 TsaB, partial [Dehalococcoidia bacterium]|nr:tRNA (adenosine(37)-N6)-threonylcarbamoyltransferase complex dimerization subunit type 1 TsaB [Dehalococcoidia bacterium]
MAELGIDTASQTIALAVLEGERVLAERRWRLETTASRELLAGIDELLRDAGIERDAIEAIAVNVGPGAYTGLRSGVATAQGLALGLGVPLAGVARLEADAFPHVAPGVPVV